MFFWIPDFEGVYSINSTGIIIANERPYVDKNGVSFKKSFKVMAMGGLDRNGYKYISLRKDGKSKSYRLYQILARTFLIDNRGTSLQVDHKDRNRVNDDLTNLRMVHRLINGNNRKHNKTSSTKVRGVAFSKQHSKWKVMVNEDKRLKYLGLFNSMEEALKIREEFQNKKFEELLDKYPPIDIFSPESRVQKILQGLILPSLIVNDDFWVGKSKIPPILNDQQTTLAPLSELTVIPKK